LQINVEKSAAWVVLSNNGSKEQLIRSVDQLYEKYFKNKQKGSKILDRQEIMF